MFPVNGRDIWVDSDENGMPQSASNTSRINWKEMILRKENPFRE